MSDKESQMKKIIMVGLGLFLGSSYVVQADVEKMVCAQCKHVLNQIDIFCGLNEEGVQYCATCAKKLKKKRGKGDDKKTIVVSDKPENDVFFESQPSVFDGLELTLEDFHMNGFRYGIDETGSSLQITRLDGRTFHKDAGSKIIGLWIKGSHAIIVAEKVVIGCDFDSELYEESPREAAASTDFYKAGFVKIVPYRKIFDVEEKSTASHEYTLYNQCTFSFLKKCLKVDASPAQPVGTYRYKLRLPDNLVHIEKHDSTGALVSEDNFLCPSEDSTVLSRGAQLLLCDHTTQTVTLRDFSEDRVEIFVLEPEFRRRLSPYYFQMRGFSLVPHDEKSIDEKTVFFNQ